MVVEENIFIFRTLMLKYLGMTYGTGFQIYSKKIVAIAMCTHRSILWELRKGAVPEKEHGLEPILQNLSSRGLRPSPVLTLEFTAAASLRSLR